MLSFRYHNAYVKIIFADLNGQMGSINVDYDRKFSATNKMADEISFIQQKKAINQEGRNFVEKLEKEARDKVTN